MPRGKRVLFAQDIADRRRPISPRALQIWALSAKFNVQRAPNRQGAYESPVSRGVPSRQNVGSSDGNHQVRVSPLQTVPDKAGQTPTPGAPKQNIVTPVSSKRVAANRQLKASSAGSSRPVVTVPAQSSKAVMGGKPPLPKQQSIVPAPSAMIERSSNRCTNRRPEIASHNSQRKSSRYNRGKRSLVKTHQEFVDSLFLFLEVCK